MVDASGGAPPGGVYMVDSSAGAPPGGVNMSDGDSESEGSKEQKCATAGEDGGMGQEVLSPSYREWAVAPAGRRDEEKSGEAVGHALRI